MINTKTTIVTVSVALGFTLTASILKLDALNSLIATGLKYDFMRIFFLGALIASLLTTAPRSLPFRLVLGAAGGIFHVTIIYMLLNYQIGLLDGMLCMAAAVICELTALEAETTLQKEEFHSTSLSKSR